MVSNRGKQDIMTKKYDVVVVGASIGGVLGAYSLAKKGYKVLLTEATDWIGGQLTSQGVPSDEHRFIEDTGCSLSYRNYRNRVRDIYRNNPNFKEFIKNQKTFNPGNGWVSLNAHEPIIALQVFNEMLAPFIESGLIELSLNTIAVDAINTDHHISEVTLKNEQKTFTVEAKYFLDGTDNGDLLPITKTDYVTGAESYKEYNEPHAPLEAAPHDMQPITWVAAMAYEEGGHNRIAKPPMYDLFKSFKMPFDESILSWYAAGLDLNSKRLYSLWATKGTSFEKTPQLFTYRQIIEPKFFNDTQGIYPTTILNWPQNDYFFGNIIENDDTEYHQYAAKQLTLSLVYWLQTEALRCDGKGYGYPEIKLTPEVLGTKDGLAKAPYIRESRRIKSLYTIKEQDISMDHNEKPKFFWDSVGVGFYHIDLHMTTESKTHFFNKTWPFQIPLGSLIPVKTKNLLPVCKNIGTTHITNGCYRLHPIEWNIGESAGLLVAYCLKHNLTPQTLYADKKEVASFQAYLKEEGIQLDWPKYVFE